MPDVWTTSGAKKRRLGIEGAKIIGFGLIPTVLGAERDGRGVNKLSRGAHDKGGWRDVFDFNLNLARQAVLEGDWSSSIDRGKEFNLDAPLLGLAGNIRNNGWNGSSLVANGAIEAKEGGLAVLDTSQRL